MKKKMSKIVSLAMAAALAAASLSMSASADGEDKIEIAITGGGEDSMQLNTQPAATSTVFPLCVISMKASINWMPTARSL